MDSSDQTTRPVTVGQLSVWRDIERMPPPRRWEANLTFVWDLPPGRWDAEAVWTALGDLAMRHASLRTTYPVGPDGLPRQHVAAHDARTVIRAVAQGTADVSAREAMEADRLQEAIDAGTRLPWRAWILTDGGEPSQVLLVVNHMAVDGAAALVLRADFEKILGGARLPAAPGPLELALDQHGAGSARLRNAERYWRRTLDAAPHRRLEADTAPEPAGAVLHTGVPLPMAHDGAAKLGVSLASLLLTAYYAAVRDVTGERAVLLYPMSSNRYDAEHAEVVTSLNQWVPLLLDLDPGQPFEAIAPKVHWKAFNALKHGVYDPDAILAVRAEHERREPPVDPGYHYNPILAPPGFPSQDRIAAPHVEWFAPARSTGPGFYVIARALTSVDLRVSVRRPGFDRPAVEACLASIQRTLVDAVGGEHLRPPRHGA